MRRLMMNLSVVCFLAYARVAFSYEIKTHEELSEQAVTTSVLQSNSSVIANLGLKPIDDRDQRFPNSREVPRTILQLIQDGSAFEDDNPRALAHFYNPVTGAPLVSAGLPSPDWALEDRGPRRLLLIYEQNDSFTDTRQFFLDALTLEAEEERRAKWGRTFQGLGQVIHHLQDMAQPQHARNDAHLKVSENGDWFFENPSLYEILTREKDIRQIALTYAPVHGAEEPLTFDIPRRLWHTGDGKGIADYTNRGFVSAGTNFDQYDPVRYPLPEIGQEWAEDKTALCQQIGSLPKGSAGQVLPCVMTFFRTYVHDLYRPSESRHNEKTSTHSLFTADLKAYNPDGIQVYTLNRENFNEAHQFLIPRAVGYSAGMINYFFRGVGQMDVVEDPTDPNRLLLQNLSDEALDGTFTLYYDDADENRSPVPGAQWTVSLAGRGETPVAKFPPPSTPTPKKAGEYLLVFKGTMGQESDIAVAATLIHPPAPESFLLDHRLSLTQDQNNQWVLAAEEDLQYGTTNWIGEAGVLSYDGGTIYRGGRVLAMTPTGYRVSAAALQPDPDNPPHVRLVAILLLPLETTTTTSVWVKALSGTHREWRQQFPLNLDFTPMTAWRFNQAGTKTCVAGSRTTSHQCTFTLKDFGSYEYPAYDCITVSTSTVIEVDMASGAMTDHPLGSSTSIFRSDDRNHGYNFYSGTAGIGADYRNNFLTVATSTSTSENEFEGSILKGVYPYWDRSSYSRTVAIDGAVYFSSNGSREQNWRWLYPEGIWEGSGMVDWTEAGFAALDLRGPWFVYTISHESGTATGGGPVNTESPGRWTTQSSFDLGTNHDGVLSTDNGTPSRITWALDRQDNVAFSLKVGEDTWINRLNGQDLGALTGLTGEIPALGIR